MALQTGRHENSIILVQFCNWHPWSFRVKTKAVPGGRTAREIAEQKRLNELGGLNKTENLRNPIGPGRRYMTNF